MQLPGSARNLSCTMLWLLLLFLAYSVLVANPKKLLYTVPNHGRGLLNKKKRIKEEAWQHTPPPPSPTLLVRRKITKALHGRLAGRFKPPLAGRCNDFAPSRQKNCHRQKQPSRPGPRKKKKNTAPSRPVEKKQKSHPVPPRKKKKTPRPASEKKTNRPVPPRKKKKTPRPAMNSKIHRPEGGNWKQIPPPVSFSLFLVAHLYRL